MKNRILFSLVVVVIPFFSFAQIDDMYFVPQKETKEQKEQQTRSQPSMHAISESVATTASNEHVQNNARDVDEYNRRYRWENDSTAANEEETANEENARADSIQGLEEDYQYQTNSSFQHPNYRRCGQQSFILGLTLWSQFHILGCI